MYWKHFFILSTALGHKLTLCKLVIVVAALFRAKYRIIELNIEFSHVNLPHDSIRHVFSTFCVKW